MSQGRDDDATRDGVRDMSKADASSPAEDKPSPPTLEPTAPDRGGARGGPHEDAPPRSGPRLVDVPYNEGKYARWRWEIDELQYAIDALCALERPDECPRVASDLFETLVRQCRAFKEPLNSLQRSIAAIAEESGELAALAREFEAAGDAAQCLRQALEAYNRARVGNDTTDPDGGVVDAAEPDATTPTRWGYGSGHTDP